MNKITIEKVAQFSPDLVEGLNNLLFQLVIFAKPNPLTKEDIERMIRENRLFIARDADEKIVGMVTLIVYKIPSVTKGVLEEIVVDEQYRQKGIATLLVKAVLEEARKEGIIYVDLRSHPKREAANKFYEKFGFVKRETNVYRLNLDNYEQK